MGLIKFGNHKLGTDTLIFNMTAACDCPSRKLGLCQVVNKGMRCYADKAEIQYGNCVINARRAQGYYWSSTSSNEIVDQFVTAIRKRKTVTRYFRFNESGDFNHQEDIRKLSDIARELKKINIVTYGYTARSDLDFTGVEFIIRGSGHDKCSDGKTIVINKDERVPGRFMLCPGDCKICSVCKNKRVKNIAFRKH